MPPCFFRSTLTAASRKIIPFSDDMAMTENHTARIEHLRVLERENKRLREKIARYEKGKPGPTDSCHTDPPNRPFFSLEGEEMFRRLVETMNEGLIILDRDGCISYVNRHLEDISGFRSEELVGKKIDQFLSPEASQTIYRRLSGEDPSPQPSFEITWKRKTGERQFSIVSPQGLEDSGDGNRRSFAIITDITAKKHADNALRQREKELRGKNVQLEEMNTALRTLVEIREQDKKEIEGSVSANLKTLMAPLIEKLHSSGLNERQKLYVSLLMANLEEISSSYGIRFSSRLLVLTPAEMEVANLVRHGQTTKEIASLMNISARTVDMHRLNIRRKLGIHRKRTNLRTYLLST